MWKKINNFTYSHSLLSTSIYSIFFISILSVFGYLIFEIPQDGLPPGINSLFPFTILQMVLTSAIILLMRKLEIFQISDFGIKYFGKGLILAWVGIIGIFGTFFMSYFSYYQFPGKIFIFSNIFYFLLVLFHPLIGTALFEETLFRGLVLKILLRKYGHTKNGIILSCVIPSILFGVVHISNYPLVGISVISQIIIPIAHGLFYAALYLRTKTLLVPIFIHGFTNIAHQIFYAIISPDIFLQIAEAKSQNQLQVESVTFGNVFLILLSTLPYIIAGFILLKKVTPEKIWINIVK